MAAAQQLDTDATADNEAAPVSREAFRAAVHQMTSCSCCGGARAGIFAVKTPGRSHPMAALGHAEWRKTIRPAKPIFPVERGPFRLPGVTLAEPGKPVLANQDLWVEGGQIVRIAPAGASPPGRERTIEGLRGHVVVPALTDMHVHMPPANALKLTPLFLMLTLRHGVVRVREAGDPDGTATPAALAMVESGATPGPDIRYCYNFVTTGPARWANSLQASSPDQVREVVDQLVAVGATWIKSYENLDAAAITALVGAAQARGLQVMGHVPTRLKVEEAGIPDPQHYFGVPDPSALRRDHVVDRTVDWESVTPTRIDEVVAYCLRQGTAMTPTLSSHCNIMRLEHWETERRAADVRMLPSLFSDVLWHPTRGLPLFSGLVAADFARGRAAYEKKLALTAALARAGVTLRLGTDTLQPFTVPGAALHAEIAQFEAAGVSREAAWSRASAEAGAALGVPQAGRLAVGAPADLIVSPTSPLAPGWSPQALAATVAGGTLMLAADLDTAIRREQARFESDIGGHVMRWLAQAAVNRIGRNVTG